MSDVEIIHLPVMHEEILEMLNPRQDGVYVDATIGLGGHAEKILTMIGPEGKLIGIDRDDEALKAAEKRLSDQRVILLKGRFSDMGSLIHTAGVEEVDGILFDLGVSMLQLRDMDRGFSFLSDKPLDMRMDRGQDVSARDIVNRYPERELERIIREFGEERLSKRIARAIIRRRGKKPIETCAELSGIVEQACGRRGRTHPATRTFQALRIVVNRELEQLRAGLDEALRLLKIGGRLCVVSYHSLEDRIVKNFMADNARKGALTLITKKPRIPSSEEMKRNPSSRSAKLRAAERMC